MSDLSTKYLGLTLKNPLVASASPAFKKGGYGQEAGRCRSIRGGDVFPF